MLKLLNANRFSMSQFSDFLMLCGLQCLGHQWWVWWQQHRKLAYPKKKMSLKSTMHLISWVTGLTLPFTDTDQWQGRKLTFCAYCVHYQSQNILLDPSGIIFLPVRKQVTLNWLPGSRGTSYENHGCLTYCSFHFSKYLSETQFLQFEFLSVNMFIMKSS